MPTCDPVLIRAARRTVAILIAVALCAAWCPAIHAQVGIATTRAVGGISVDPSGLLENALLDEIGKLQQSRAKALQAIPGELNQATESRKVSLRRLEAKIQQCLRGGQKLPDDITYLAGLQQIHHVFVYPEQNDIVLAGPGEGWKVDGRGNIVGVTSGRAVMLLDDLLVALRTARAAAQGGISCSIDPTPEGLVRLREHTRRLRTIGDPRVTAAGIEQVLGPQMISVSGVPDNSHFARVMVAADYRMKRLAMNFEPAPVRNLPSFLQMLKAGGRGMRNMLPRWWLAPAYEPLLRDAQGLAWQFQGGSVKAMTEEDVLAADGSREHTGRSSSSARRWAETMTMRYDELAVADPVFGQLRNCMELAIVAALLVKENLLQKADLQMPVLMDSGRVAVGEFAVPKQVNSQASLMKKGRNWFITASGGVQVNSWEIADRVQQSNTPATARAKAAPAGHTNWWWN